MDEYFRNRAEVDDPDLLRDRRANDNRLKSRFEHIFAKYEKDFTGVGDEIDLETGEIIVNNGHLSNMRHEVDPGKITTSGLVGTLADGGDWEDDTAGNTGEDEEGADLVETGGSGNTGDAEGSQDDDGRSSGYSSSGIITDGEEERDELSSDFYPENADLATKETKGQSDATERRAAGSGDDTIGFESGESSQSTSRDASPGGLVGNLPFLTESLQAIQTNHKGAPLDGAAIQALGQSIASQLAQYMKRAPTKESRRAQRKERDRDSAWTYPALPTDKRRRTLTPPPPQPLSSSAALFTRSPSDGGSIWAPVQHPRPHKRQRTTLARETVFDTNTDNDADIDPLQSDSPHHSPRIAAEQPPAIECQRPRECANCGETKTPNFRKGPQGEDLCNACGMYFYRYGLLKPPYDPDPEPLPPQPEPQPGTFSVLIPKDHGILPGDEYDIPVTPEGGNTASYPANTARRVVANGVRMTRWTTEEDEKIIKLREVDNYPWETIGRIVSGRSAYAVQCRYSTNLRGENVEARRRLLEHGIPVQQPHDQLDDKDLTVVDLDEDSTGNSVNRTPSKSRNPPLMDHNGLPNACALARLRMEQRGMRTSYHDLHDEQCRVFKRFTDEENETIIRLREVEDMPWEQIHRYLPGRTLQSLQKHYRRELYEDPFDEDPLSEGSIDLALFTKDKKPLKFSKEEDELIVKMKEAEDMPFTEMTEYLSERTEDALSRRYTYIKSRALASKQDPPRPPHKVERENDQAVRQFALPYPDSTPYQQAVPGSSTQPARGHLHTDCSHSTYGGAHRPNPAGQDNGSRNVPQTPAASMQPPHFPLRPTEVGPSAWAATQPASKGPLPFQPARKSTVPIQSAPRWPVPADPFESLPLSRRKALGPERGTYSRASGPGGRAGSAGAAVRESPSAGLATLWQASEVLPSQAAHSRLVRDVPGTNVRSQTPLSNRNVGNLRKSAASSQRPRTSVGERRARATTVHRSTSPKLRFVGRGGIDVAPFGRPTSLETRSVQWSGIDVAPFATNEPDTLDDQPQSEVPGIPQVPTPDPTSGLPDSKASPQVPEHPFSNDEDKLIKKWREKEGACWSEIAERLPHHTQQAVTDRYYDLILGNSKSVKTAVALNNRDPLDKHGRRYRGSESAKVLAMRDQGLSWEQMAEHLPGRTAASVANHFFHTIVGSARISKHRAANVPSRETPGAMPLLKRALGNAVRQASVGPEREGAGGYDEITILPPGANGPADDIWAFPPSASPAPQSMPSTPPGFVDRETSVALDAAAAVDGDVDGDSIMYKHKLPADVDQSPEMESSPGLQGPSPEPQQDDQAMSSPGHTNSTREPTPQQSTDQSLPKKALQSDDEVVPMPQVRSYEPEVMYTRLIDLSQPTEASRSHSPVDQHEIPDSQSLEPEDLAGEPMAMDAPRSSPPTQTLPPFHSETPLDEHQYRTPSHEATIDPHDATSEPNLTAAYETPARFNSQTLPYFVAPAADMVEPLTEEMDSEPPVMEWHRIHSGSEEHVHPSMLQEKEDFPATAQKPQPKKSGRPPKRRRPSEVNTEPATQYQTSEVKQPAPKRKPGRPKKVATQSKKPEDNHLATPEADAPNSSQISARSTGRRKCQSTLLSDPPLNSDLIPLISLAIKSHPDICMYTREITEWIAEHHLDQAATAPKLDSTVHFHLSGSREFTNLRPGEYQPLWTLTAEVDSGVRASTGRSGKRVKGIRKDGSAAQTTPEATSSQPATVGKEAGHLVPAAAPKRSGWGGKRVKGQRVDVSAMHPTPKPSSSQPATARKGTVSLVASDEPVRQPKRSAQAFDSDDTSTPAAANPANRRSLPATNARPAKKARRSEPGVLSRKVVAVMPLAKREGTGTPSGEYLGKGSVSVGEGRKVVVARDGEGEGDEDELA